MLQPYASRTLGQEIRRWQGLLSHISYFAKDEVFHALLFHIKLVDNLQWCVSNRSRRG